MYHVHSNNQRYTHTTLLDGNVLQSANLIDTLYIKYTSHITVHDITGDFSIYLTSGCYISGNHQIKLTYFLLESHLGHQLIDVFIHRLLLGYTGRSDKN